MATPLKAIMAAFLTTFALTPLVIKLARKLGALDLPGERKAQKTGVPLLGGIAIALGVLVGLGFFVSLDKLLLILVAALFVFLIGLIDDIKDTPPALRITLEIIAASVVVASGVRATFYIPLPWLTIPLSVMWIVGITNSFNMLDNMDGLSGGIAGITSTIFALLCFNTNQPNLGVAFACIAGGVLGFLPYNFRPAKIYMGDAGALFIGFLIGSLSISTTFSISDDTTVLPVVAPLLILSIPLFDTASVFFIRLREGRPLLKGDRRHFSHRLVDLGMSERVAVGTIYLVSAAIGLGALFLKHLNMTEGFLLLLQALLIFGIIVLMEIASQKKDSK